jgi:preprotein translocase subunit SecF
VQAAVGVQPVTLDVATVGRSVADDAVRNSITAVAVASILVMIYIGYAFRSLPHWHRYAIITIVTLIHDAVIAMGVIAVLGQIIGTEVNAIFIVGILTVIGYSVNDTIVIFDRIRENALIAPNRSFATTVNLSINETLGRSLATSFTTGIVVLAMLLFGGDTLQDFLIVLMTGVVVGAYSSIFVAASLLVWWEDGRLGRFFGMPFRIFRRRQAEPA